MAEFQVFYFDFSTGANFTSSAADAVAAWAWVTPVTLDDTMAWLLLEVFSRVARRLVPAGKVRFRSPRIKTTWELSQERWQD